MKFRFWFFIIACFFLKIPIQAQQTVDFIHKNLSIEHGLPESTVLDITEDDLGFIWLATPNFLCRFDGSDFRIFQKSFDHSVDEESFMLGKLFIDKDKLWIITKGGKLEYLDLKTESFHSVEKFYGSDESIPQVRTMLFEQNRIYLGTQQNGMYVTNSDLKVINQFDTHSPQALSSDRINYIFRENEEKIWILTDKGINSVTFGIVSQFETDKNFTFSLVYPNNSRLAFSTLSNGLWHKLPAWKSIYYTYNQYPQFAHLMKELRIIDMFLEKKYATYKWGIWLATLGQGLKVISNRDISIVDVELIGNPMDIYCIFGSENGKIWIGSKRNGLYVIDPVLAIEKVDAPHGADFEDLMKINSAHSKEEFLVSKKGDVFFAGGENTLSKVFNILEIFPDHAQIKNYRLFPVHGTGEWLLSSLNMGEYIIDPLSKKFSKLEIANYGEITDQITNELDQIFYSNNELDQLVVWANSTGLFFIDRNKKQISEIILSPVEQLFEVEPSILAVFFKNGNVGWLDITRKDFVQKEHLKNVLPPNIEINSIRLQNEWLWIATLGKGIFLVNIENGKKVQFTKEKGLPNDFVMGMEFSDTRTVWCSTNNGLYRLNFAKTEETISLEDVLYLNYKNGLAINEFNPGISFHLGADKICFGGVGGILCLKSQDSFWEEYESHIIIPEIKANGQEVRSEMATHFIENLNLAHDQNSLEFYFTSVSRNVPENLHYSYRLEGYDEDWISSGNRRYASYTNLEPGNYIFKVKSTNVNYPGAPLRSLGLNIQKAYWQTIWFKVLVIIIIVSLIYQIYLLRINYILNIERVKEEISADLHDDLGARLTTIQLLSAIHKPKFQHQPEIKKLLTSIDLEINNSSEALHELVGNIKMREDQLEDYFSKLRRYASETLDQANLKYRISVPNNLRQVSLSLKKRKDIFFILKELINNIRKHADADYVEIIMENNGKFFVLTVIDNGKGFDPSMNSDRNGIKNLRSRVERDKGTIHIKSGLEKGTKISAMIPFDRMGFLKNIWSKSVSKKLKFRFFS